MWIMCIFLRAFSTFAFLDPPVFFLLQTQEASEELTSCLSHNVIAVCVTSTSLEKHKQAVLEIPVFMSRYSLLI